MAEIIYVLCATTSLSCALLLLRAYFRSRTSFLLWSGLCFVGLATNNIVLIFDMIVYPERNLSFWRALPAFIGMVLLMVGFVWDAVWPERSMPRKSGKEI